eukprot:403346132
MNIHPKLLKNQLTKPILVTQGQDLLQNKQGYDFITEGSNYIDMKKRWPRFMILALVCFMKFSTYFLTNTPGSITQELLEKYEITNVEYGMLFSIYSIPNIFLSLVTGLVIDRMGIRKSTICFNFIILFGQGLFALSSYIESYYLALIGRLILGIATESLGVAVVIIINLWFQNKEIGFACAILITISKAGTSMSNLLSPQIMVAADSITYVLCFGFLLQSIAFICAFAFSKIDSTNEKNLQFQKEISQQTLDTSDSVQKQGFISIAFIKTLSAQFWFFALVCLLSYCTFGPFQNNISLILRVRFGFGILEAGEIMAYLVIVSTVICPFIGYVSDKVNQRILTLALASLVLTISHFYTAIMPDSQRSLHIIFPLVLYEIAVGLFISNMWAALNELVDKQRLGFGVGLVNSAQNIGQAIAPIMIGVILDQNLEDKSYGLRQISYFMAFISLTYFIILLCQGMFSKIGYSKDKQPRKFSFNKKESCNVSLL